MRLSYTHRNISQELRSLRIVPREQHLETPFLKSNSQAQPGRNTEKLALHRWDVSTTLGIAISQVESFSFYPLW